MGLDMYLTANRYVAGYDFYKEEDREPYNKVIEVLDAGDFVDPNTPSATVSVTVAYWRKANQIHKWFVDNVQGGVDDCREYYVGREQLQQLKQTCEEVLKSLKMQPAKIQVGTRYAPGEGEVPIIEDGQIARDSTVAEELLPSQEGFFFGGTDYDNWYVEDLKNTVTQLDRALQVPTGWNFEYRSSW